MCGRFYSNLTWAEYQAYFGVVGPPPESNFEPAYNIAPTQAIWIMVGDEGQRRLVSVRWGLVPLWAREMPNFSTFNAKVESLGEKASWKGSLNKYRCVIPVSGFYEWTGPKSNRQPYAIRRGNGAPLALAGLWAINTKLGDELLSATIVTVPANDYVSELHTRMPAILDGGGIAQWLGDAPWGPEVAGLLKPCPEDWLEAAPVSQSVNSSRAQLEGPPDPIGDALTHKGQGG